MIAAGGEQKASCSPAFFHMLRGVGGQVLVATPHTHNRPPHLTSVNRLMLLRHAAHLLLLQLPTHPPQKRLLPFTNKALEELMLLLLFKCGPADVVAAAHTSNHAQRGCNPRQPCITGSRASEPSTLCTTRTWTQAWHVDMHCINTTCERHNNNRSILHTKHANPPLLWWRWWAAGGL